MQRFNYWKEFKCLRFNLKNTCKSVKLYFILKSHQRLLNGAGRPMINNCTHFTDKIFKFLGNHLQPIMGKSLPHILKRPVVSLIKVRKISVPDHFVEADVATFYPSISQDNWLKALREAHRKGEEKIISTNKLVQMAEPVLTNFKFDGQIKQKISRTATGTKGAPTKARIFIIQMEAALLQDQEKNPFTWFQYIHIVLLIWTHVENENWKHSQKILTSSIPV